jgi:hypothetical protein
MTAVQPGSTSKNGLEKYDWITDVLHVIEAISDALGFCWAMGGGLCSC